jgi:hypothetical protein
MIAFHPWPTGLELSSAQHCSDLHMFFSDLFTDSNERPSGPIVNY